ncbi:MAG: MBL fold metallo-hydrolase [Cyclobacteriaceae bacterium]
MRTDLLAVLSASIILFCCAQQKSESRWCDDLPREAYLNLQKTAFSNDWFEVYEVQDSIYAIYEPFQWQEVISYLIIGEDFALLFDSGNGIGDIKSVVTKITELPIRVLNSHSHYDHVGGNADFSFVYGIDTDFTKSRMKGLPHERVAEEVSDAALCKGLPVGVKAEDHHIRPYDITQLMKDGDTINLGNRILEIISIPGHTPDAIALLDRESGLLWTGDSYYAGPIWLFAPETDWNAYKNSVERVSALVPLLKYLLPAHNTPLEDPAHLTALANAVNRVDRGESKPTRRNDENLIFEFGHFSLLLGPQVLEK